MRPGREDGEHGRHASPFEPLDARGVESLRARDVARREGRTDAMSRESRDAFIGSSPHVEDAAPPCSRCGRPRGVGVDRSGFPQARKAFPRLLTCASPRAVDRREWRKSRSAPRSPGPSGAERGGDQDGPAALAQRHLPLGLARGALGPVGRVRGDQGRVADFEAVAEVGDRQLLSRPHHAVADAMPIDECPVGAAQVADDERNLVEGQAAVAPRHARRADPNVASATAPDHRQDVRQVDVRRSAQGKQARGHRSTPSDRDLSERRGYGDRWRDRRGQRRSATDPLT